MKKKFPRKKKKIHKKKDISIQPELFSQHCFIFQGGSTSVTKDKQRTDKGQKFLCLIMNYCLYEMQKIVFALVMNSLCQNAKGGWGEILYFYI